MQLPWPFLFIPERCSRSNPVSSIYNVPGNGISKGTALSGNGLVSGSGVAAGSNGDKSADGTQKVTAGNKTLTSKEYNKSRSERLKFTYKEQKEYVYR